MSPKSHDDAYHFDGFDNPTTTPVPDVVFDQFLAALGEAELKALLYIIRRTFGFKKDRDPISFNQFLRGITARDGQSLDRGCGVRNRTTLSAALKSLEDKGIIRSEKGMDEQGENATTVYSLRFKDSRPRDETASEEARATGPDAAKPEVEAEALIDKKLSGGVVRETYYPSTRNVLGGGTRNVLPVVRETYQQQTVKQQTDVVVVEMLPRLIFFGVEKRTAERLAQSYPAEHLREKIALLEWKLRQAGHRRRIGDPAAWLVRAIEQDYRPPAQFRPDASQRRTVQTALEFARQESDGPAVDVPQTAWQRALDALRRQHGTTAAEIDLWAETLAEIKGATTQATFQTWFVQTEILALRDGHAIIAVPNRATKEWLLGRLSPIILRALQDVVGASVAIKMVVYDE